jgi:hypothetical protein
MNNRDVSFAGTATVRLPVIKDNSYIPPKPAMQAIIQCHSEVLPMNAR